MCSAINSDAETEHNKQVYLSDVVTSLGIQLKIIWR